MPRDLFFLSPQVTTFLLMSKQLFQSRGFLFSFLSMTKAQKTRFPFHSVSHKGLFCMLQCSVTLVLFQPSLANCLLITLDRSFMYMITYVYSEVIVILRTWICACIQITLQIAICMKDIQSNTSFLLQVSESRHMIMSLWIDQRHDYVSKYLIKDFSTVPVLRYTNHWLMLIQMEMKWFKPIPTGIIRVKLF